MAKQTDLWILVADLERHAPAAMAHVGAVGTDALGRAWVSDADARAAIAAVVAEDRRELEDRQAYSRWVDDRAQRRQALATKAREKAVGGHPANALSSAEAAGRVREALARFDEREPELDYYRWRDSR